MLEFMTFLPALEQSHDPMMLVLFFLLLDLLFKKIRNTPPSHIRFNCPRHCRAKPYLSK